MGNSWEEKQERRKERYLERAEKADTESEHRYKAAKGISDFIPFGQPILVGHHSEKRHRRDLERIDTNMRKNIEASQKAEHYRDKAAGVGKGGISSDDPDALVKLRQKLEQLQARQGRMKAINAAWRKAKKPKADNAEGWQQVAEIMGPECEEWVSSARIGMARDFMDRAPYTYEITNNNGNMKRIKDRITALERQEGDETTERELYGVTITENVEENRLQLFFPGKPSEKIRGMLKSYGFRWSRYNSAWQRHRSDAATYWAGVVVEEYGKGEA